MKNYNNCIDKVSYDTCSCSANAISGSTVLGHAFTQNNNGVLSNAVYIGRQYLKKHKLPGDIRFVDDNGKLEQMYIKQVIYRNPATIVFWSDGSKTVCKCSGGDKYNPETGLAICILKKMCGASSVKSTLDTWCPMEEDYKKGRKPVIVSIKEVRAKEKKSK